MAKLLFQEKISYLYEQLDINDKIFIELFSEKHHKYGSRRKTVIKKWIEGEMEENPKWNFHKYPISKELVNNELGFTEKSFLEDPLKDFEKRVDNYINKKLPKSILNFEFDYKYIYYFNNHKKNILDAELKIKEKHSSRNEYKIEILVNNLDIIHYTGTLVIDKDGDYYLSVKNDFDTLTAYYVKTKSYLSEEILEGLTLSLSYVDKKPIAYKNILTKEKLNEKEKEKFYVILNETEYLISDNNRTKYFNKFYEKLKNLNFFLMHHKNNLENEIIDNTLDILVGTWHHYFYSSQRDKHNQLKIWKEELIIDNKGKVLYEIQKESALKGEINTTFNAKEVFIYLTAIDSGNLTLIKFSKDQIYKKIFKAPLMDKELSSHHDMFSFGFFSKEKLEDSVIKNILGDENKILLEKDDIQGRIDRHYNKLQYF